MSLHQHEGCELGFFNLFVVFFYFETNLVKVTFRDFSETYVVDLISGNFAAEVASHSVSIGTAEILVTL